MWYQKTFCKTKLYANVLFCYKWKHEDKRVKMHGDWRKPQGLTATTFLEGKRLQVFFSVKHLGYIQEKDIQSRLFLGRWEGRWGPPGGKNAAEEFRQEGAKWTALKPSLWWLSLYGQWSNFPVCPDLRGFLGPGIFNTKTRTVPGSQDELVSLLYLPRSCWWNPCTLHSWGVVVFLYQTTLCLLSF